MTTISNISINLHDVRPEALSVRADRGYGHAGSRWIEITIGDSSITLFAWTEPAFESLCALFNIPVPAPRLRTKEDA